MAPEGIESAQAPSLPLRYCMVWSGLAIPRTAFSRYTVLAISTSRMTPEGR